MSRPLRTSLLGSRALVATVAVVAAVPVALTGIALAPAATATPPTRAAEPDPAPVVPPAPAVSTTTTVVSRSGTDVAAGVRLHLRIRVTPAAVGRVVLSDNGRTVGSYRVNKARGGIARAVVVPRRGPHSYLASFTPKRADAYTGSVSGPVTVLAGAARSLPIARGSFGPLVRKTQKRLVGAGILVRPTGTYDKATTSAVKRFQGKFFLPQTGAVNARTMRKLVTLQVKRPPRACRTVDRAICIDKTRKVAQLVVDGTVRLSLDARFGSTSSPALQTREGIFSIQRKAVQHMSSLYHTSMPYSMFFSGGQAVHYSQYFAADGYYGASHGCVNIRDYRGVEAMYARAPLGTRVVVYRS